MNPDKNFKPPGTEFIDAKTGRKMIHVSSGSWFGWLVYQHPDGQWVTLRKATKDDLLAISAAIATQG